MQFHPTLMSIQAQKGKRLSWIASIKMWSLLPGESEAEEQREGLIEELLRIGRRSLSCAPGRRSAEPIRRSVAADDLDVPTDAEELLIQRAIEQAITTGAASCSTSHTGDYPWWPNLLINRWIACHHCVFKLLPGIDEFFKVNKSSSFTCFLPCFNFSIDQVEASRKARRLKKSDCSATRYPSRFHRLSFLDHRVSKWRFREHKVFRPLTKGADRVQ